MVLRLSREVLLSLSPAKSYEETEIHVSNLIVKSFALFFQCVLLRAIVGYP